MSENIKLVLKKVIKAPREKVFEAWTQPELMKKWYAPGEMKVPNAASTLRVGGAYHVEMKGDMGGKLVNPTVEGTYKKIIPNELVCFTWRWQGDSTEETLVTVYLRDVDGGTELTLTHEHFTTHEAKEKHQHGWSGCIANLEKFLR